MATFTILAAKLTAMGFGVCVTVSAGFDFQLFKSTGRTVSVALSTIFCHRSSMSTREREARLFMLEDHRFFPSAFYMASITGTLTKPSFVDVFVTGNAAFIRFLFAAYLVAVFTLITEMLTAQSKSSVPPMVKFRLFKLYLCIMAVVTFAGRGNDGAMGVLVTTRAIFKVTVFNYKLFGGEMTLYAGIFRVLTFYGKARLIMIELGHTEIGNAEVFEIMTNRAIR